MKDTLKAGLTHTFLFKIPETKTVPHLYPESDIVIDAARFNAKVREKAVRVTSVS
jgi:hypothetical protein